MVRWTKRPSSFCKATAMTLCAAMLAGTVFGGQAVNAAEWDGATTGPEMQGSVSGADGAAGIMGGVFAASVSGNNRNLFRIAGDYSNFVTDEEIVTWDDVKDAGAFAEGGLGFTDITWPTDAKGWVSNVFYPRESVEAPGTTFVEKGADWLAVKSKVWSEAGTVPNDSKGNFTDIYEETSVLEITVADADYKVEVTLTNPTQTEYTAKLEAEDIEKATKIKVAPGASVTKEFLAVVVDGVLSLKFAGESNADSKDGAAEQTVYVSDLKVTRLATNAEDRGKPTIYLASDSTVQTYEDYYDPQTGWGETLAMFFGGDVVQSAATDCGYSQAALYEADNVFVENRAIGGRSSRSFVQEGKLDDLLEDIRPGDYLFIQWGHNDATWNRPARYVSVADFEQWIQYYVDGARQRGAVPVLVTPVARYDYDDAKGTFKISFDDYRKVMQSLAAKEDVALVDLGQRSVDVCNNFGKNGAESLFLHVAAGEYSGAYAGGATDNTHLQWYGAYKFAQCVSQGILESGHDSLTDLKALVVPRTAEKLCDKIANLKAGTVGAMSVGMVWDEDPNAELYHIFRVKLEDGQTAADADFTNAVKYSTSISPKFTDSSCVGGATYAYAVAGYNDKGVGALSDPLVVTTKAADHQYDFNGDEKASVNGNKATLGKTMEGWTGVSGGAKGNDFYSKEKGYGWAEGKAPQNGRNRGSNSFEGNSDMGNDFCMGASEFLVDLPNGDYEVTIYAGDLLSGTSKIGSTYTAEGVGIGSISAKTSLGSCTATVRVEDGQLNLAIGGDNAYINGLTITELLLAPRGLTFSELDVDDATGTASFLLGFMESADAVSYTIYRKGSEDTKFTAAKSFTAQELKESGITVCGAMTGDVGEIYEFYMTCTNAEGKESAHSNVITVELFVPGDPAPAPQNLICTSPASDATELQDFISLQWEPVEGAAKYYIYRSDKAESDKGFTEFVKVGECKGNTTTFTDQDVYTNISYYYQVAALTKTGVGERSKTCKTPVAGSFVHGGMEKYTDRALVAIDLAGADGGETLVSATDKDGNEYTKGVYLSWRSFGADLDGANNVKTTFTVYKNDAVLASDLRVTNLIDPEGSAADVYRVEGSSDAAQGLSAKNVKPWANKYLELSLFAPADETMPSGATCSFSANDMSVGDLDGDGDLELIVKWYPSNAQDNSKDGYTGNTYLDGYDVDWNTGAVSLMWRINLGINIRSGAHYTQFQVWDYDGDGKAEIAVKTGDGTTTYRSTDGTVAGLEYTGHVGMASDQVLTISEAHGKENGDYRETSGYILIPEGHEFFSIFNGEDGTKAAEDVEYLPFGGNATAWGDNSNGYRNRIDRFLSATAYLDGVTPFAVFCRGYYTRTCLTAYYMKDTDGDGVGDTIDVYWTFDTKEAGSQYQAQGNHGLSVNDVDNDGKDEILYGSLAIDHDGTVKWCTFLQHGDAMHVSDWISWNPGLEVMQVHEDKRGYDVEIHDAETGEILMGYQVGGGYDVGRGVAADIDPTSKDAEWWAIAGPDWKPEGNQKNPPWNSTKAQVYAAASTLGNLIKLSDGTPSSNFTLFWDGDLLSELQDHNFDEGPYAPIGVNITKWNWDTNTQETLLYSEEIWSSNGTKGNVGLVADILGDWREEIIARCSADKNKVRVYSTTIETDYVVPCLLENLAYREGVAWQNVGYNQPANLNYMLSQGVVTAQLSNAKTGSDYVQFDFTDANDGDLYGHEILGYRVYRAEGDGEYELHDEYVFEGMDITQGRNSFLSDAFAATSAILVGEAPEFDVPDLVEGMPIPAGGTVANLLPDTVDVVDHQGEAKKTAVTWDVSGVDINTPGSYTVIATVAGWPEPLTKTLKVVPNEVKGYAPLDDVTVLQNQALDPKALPEKVKVSYTNTTEEEVGVTWETSKVDTSVVGSYTVTGTLEKEIAGLKDKPTITVKVEADVIKSAENASCQIDAGTADVAAALPATVAVTWASGKKSDEAVQWDVSKVDANTAGTYEATGTISGYDGTVKCSVYVAYKVVKQFDFGAENGPVSDGWTGVKVNKKSGSKTYEQLGSLYTQEKGYGFADNNKTDGRYQTFTYNVTEAGKSVPKEVYQDIALCGNETFLIDLPNGTYYVEFVSSGPNMTSGNNDLSATLEGTVTLPIVRCTMQTYAIGGVQVDVNDGQLNIKFGSGTMRLAGIIVRQVSLAEEGTASVSDISAQAETMGTLVETVDNVVASAVERAIASTIDTAAASRADTAEPFVRISNGYRYTDTKDVQPNTTYSYRVAAVVKGTPDEADPDEVDKSALRKAVTEADKLADSESLYTEESWAEFTGKLTEAKEVLADDNATAEEVEAARTALIAAQEALVKKPVDKTALQKAVEEADKLADSEALYTEESWTEFAGKLAEAKAVLADDNATAEEVDTATKALTAAQAALVEKPAAETPTPTPTGEPAVTATPAPTGEPAVTATPAPTGEPAATATPAPTGEPAATATPAPADVSMDVKPSEGVPPIGVEDISEEELKAFLDEDDLEQLAGGIDIKLVIEAEAMKDEDISAPVLTALTAKVTGNGLNVALKLNIDLVKYITGKTPQLITEPKAALTLTIDIPEEFRTAPAGSKREFYIVRTHELGDGSVQTDILNDLDQDEATITFASDKFSVYALAYKDTKLADNEPDGNTSEDSDGKEDLTVNSNPKTGDRMNVWTWIILLACCVAGVAAVFGVKVYCTKRR